MCNEFVVRTLLLILNTPIPKFSISQRRLEQEISPGEILANEWTRQI